LAILLLGGSTMDVAPGRSFGTPHAPPPPLAAPRDDIPTGALGQEAGHVPPPGPPPHPTSYHARLASAVVDGLQGLARLQAVEVTFFDRKAVAEISAGLPGVKVRLHPSR
jgi:hypothetical protein